MALLAVASSASAPKRSDDLSNHRHRQLIGYIGLALPTLLILVVVWRDGWAVWEGLDSVSAYYYTGANPLFAGMLFVLALFLLTYEGYENKYQKYDRWFARVAAVAAAFVAFFPTEAPKIEGIAELAWWKPWVGVVHFASAAVLFAIFALFCLWLFRATEKSAGKPGPQYRDPDPDKKRRNVFYFVCGVVIVVCIVWAGFNGLDGRPIFWPECIALIAFAASWLIKGYWMRSIADVARSWLAPKPEAVQDDELPRGGGR